MLTCASLLHLRCFRGRRVIRLVTTTFLPTLQPSSWVCVWYSSSRAHPWPVLLAWKTEDRPNEQSTIRQSSLQHTSQKRAGRDNTRACERSFVSSMGPRTLYLCTAVSPPVIASLSAACYYGLETVRAWIWWTTRRCVLPVQCLPAPTATLIRAYCHTGRDCTTVLHDGPRLSRPALLV